MSSEVLVGFAFFFALVVACVVAAAHFELDGNH